MFLFTQKHAIAKQYSEFHNCVEKSKLPFPNIDIRDAFVTKDGKVIKANIPIAPGVMLISLDLKNQIQKVILIFQQPDPKKATNQLEYFSGISQCLSQITKQEFDKNILYLFKKEMKKRETNLEFFDDGGIGASYELQTKPKSLIMSVSIG